MPTAKKKTATKAKVKLRAKKPRTKAKPKAKPTPKKIVRHLEKGKVCFELVPHRKVYTAYDLAQTLGLRLEEIAKTLLLKTKAEGRRAAYCVVVLPASCNLDLTKAKRVLRAVEVELASENVFRRLGLEPGSISPFGSLYGYDVLVDQGLLKVRQALVSAESLVESVRLKGKDLVGLEQALVAVVGKKNRFKSIKKKAAPKKPAKSKKKVTVKRKPVRKIAAKPKARTAKKKR